MSSVLLRLLLGFLVLCPLCGSYGSTHLAEGYAVKRWLTEDGLPQNVVTCALQTKDGYLWFGTLSGLARFGGESFVVFNRSIASGLGDDHVSSLYEDERKVLWIGHGNGSVSRLIDGRFERYLEASSEESSKIIGMGHDGDDRLWAMRENGEFVALEAGYSITSPIAGHRPAVMNWSRSEEGEIWIVANGEVYQLSDGELTKAEFPEAENDNYTIGLGSSPEGGIWTLNDDRIRHWNTGGWVDDLGPYPWGARSAGQVLQLRDGTVAVGTIQYGLYLFFPDGRSEVHFDTQNGLPQNWIRFLYEDREGVLWVGVGGAGLVSIYPSAFSVVKPPDAGSRCSVLAVAPGRDGSVLMGTEGAGLYRYSDHGWEHFGADAGLTNSYIYSALEEREGRTWAGYFWWGGPFWLDEGVFVRPPGVEDSTSPIVAMSDLPGSESVLAANRDGVFQIVDGKSSWILRPPDGEADDVVDMTIDGEGAIWCGFSHGGIAKLFQGKPTYYGRYEGLSSDAITCLYADRGSMWIGTADSGLWRLKAGAFTRLGAEEGLIESAICKILEDDYGSFWISTRHGVQRVSREELHAVADGVSSRVEGRVYGRGDGLPTIEFSGGRQMSGCRTDDGRLWFGSSEGVVVVDPSREVTNLLEPPVYIESLHVDGKRRVLTAGNSELDIEPHHNRLEFRFSALSYVNPGKVRFRIRLDPLDEDWIDVGSSRSVSYSRLPSGEYRFQVIACNNDSVWNLDGVGFDLKVLPFYWQTWWFRFSCALLVVTVVALVVRYFAVRRLRRRMEEIERQFAVERERARISKDIHDDLGASLSRISMLSQPAKGRLLEPEKAAEKFSGIYSTARDVTRSLDVIVWAVDPRHDTLDSLVDYMVKFSQELLSAAQIRCRLRMPVEIPQIALSSEVRHNLFLAFKEALNNAVKHASANEVSLTFELCGRSCIIGISDDGIGIRDRDRKEDKEGFGNGIRNMEARLASIGGRCEVNVDPSGGTSVTLIVEGLDVNG